MKVRSVEVFPILGPFFRDEVPNINISKLPPLTAKERHKQLLEWNATEAEYPRDRCIHQLFEEQVERTPHGAAVVFEDQKLTYRKLNERSNQLAHYLRRLGVKSEERVGVCMARSLDLIVSLLGVLKAGGAYLPLDPMDPHKRLAFMLRDAGATVLLTQAGLPAGVADMGIKTVCIDADWETIAKEDRGNPDLVTTADSLIYVMYTSGSTGYPKGTEIRHRSVARLLFGVDYVELGPGTKLLQLAPVSFDASTFEIWGALLHGGRLILAPDGMPDLKELDELIRREGVTTVWLTASLFNHIVDHRPELLSSLRQVLTGGEALSVKHVRAAQEYLSEECRLVNGYGPTEGTTFTCCYDIPPNFGAEATSVPIGRPIANTQVYILDTHLQPTPVGIPGELCIGGPGLARGYLNRPDLTADKFIPDPYGGEPGARLYKTGDLARYLPDGNIEFLGRMDQQVKLRGFRIELGEIEAVLRQHPGVQDCVVIAREDIPGNKQLVAYFVSKLTERVGPSELRSYLKEKLPEYMVPAVYIALESLPLTPNGKVDRRSLPAPDLAHREAEREYIAPRTPIEELLTGIWADVLRIERVSIHDNFFELGGHSLLAVRIVSKIRQVMHIEIPVRMLFESPTISVLANQIDILIQKRVSHKDPSIPIPRLKGTKNPPLSFAQQRVWLLDQIEPGNIAYNEPVAYHLFGPLNVTALESSFNEIIHRHESLRTSFMSVNGQPVQIISKTMPLPFRVIDLKDFPESEREIEFFSRAIEIAKQPFDLTRLPLLKMTLFRMAEEHHILVLVMHHIVVDEWSLDVFFKELSSQFQAFSSGRPIPLSELPIRYVDYTVWQRKWLQDENRERQLSYWKEQLANLPFLELPTDRPHPAIQTYRGANRSFSISKELTDALKKLSRREESTLFMTLLASFQVLLHRQTGQEDIAIGSPIANRTRAEVEGLIGFFLNTLILRTDFTGQPSFREILSRVRRVCLDAYSYQDLPFEMIVEELNIKRELSRNPLFQVMFVLENAASEPLRLEGLSVKQLFIANDTAKVDLTLFVEEEEGVLRGRFEYNTDLFDAATIDRMIEHYKTLVEGIAANPEARLPELPLTPNGKVDRRNLPDPNSTPNLMESNYQGPTDRYELLLTQIWEKLFDVRHVGVTDDFFQLGGHSLLAAHMFGEIEKSCGKRFPLRILFEAPTIRKLAALLRKDGWQPSWSSLLPIQPSGTKPPLFCVPPRGVALFYYRLSCLLGPDQPVYALLATPDGERNPFKRIEDEAAYYTQVIRTRQPQGPYFLTGYSYGGNVVYEMAQQLCARGEKVALLALLDSSFPPTDLSTKVGRYRRRLTHILHLGPRGLMASLKDHLEPRALMIQLEDRLRKLTGSYLYSDDQRLLLYRPQPYLGRVAFFRTMGDQFFESWDPLKGLSRLAFGGLDVYDVPGGHLTMMDEPNVRILAELLGAHLLKAHGHD